MMMKRGCKVIMVHFHNENQAKEGVKDKILKLTEQLSKFQINTKLYIVPFEEIQRKIIDIILRTLITGFIAFVVLEFIKPGFVSTYINLTYVFILLVVFWLISTSFQKN